MSSSIEYGEKLRLAREVNLATDTVLGNTSRCSPEELHQAYFNFEQLRRRLDKVPMTRKERAELDDMISSINLVLGNNT
jgi:hypothetical protein